LLWSWQLACGGWYRKDAVHFEVGNGDERRGADVIEELLLCRFQHDTAAEYVQEVQKIIGEAVRPLRGANIVEFRGARVSGLTSWVAS